MVMTSQTVGRLPALSRPARDESTAQQTTTERSEQWWGAVAQWSMGVRVTIHSECIVSNLSMGCVSPVMDHETSVREVPHWCASHPLIPGCRMAAAPTKLMSVTSEAPPDSSGMGCTRKCSSMSKMDWNHRCCTRHWPSSFRDRRRCWWGGRNSN